MAKANITEYDSTAGNNTVINDIDISEGCSPSTINNAIRELMAHLKNVDTGTQALTALSVTGAVDLNSTLNVQGETTLQTHLNMGDNDQIKLGAGADLSLYHDGSNSYITEGGTGALYALTNSLIVRNSANSESMLTATENGAVELFHNDSKKIETTSTGVNITGGIGLGGTGSANQLDDYEEGTWTVTDASGAGLTFTQTRTAQYIKVGNMVHVNAYIDFPSTSDGTGILLGGLPFTPFKVAYGSGRVQSVGTSNLVFQFNEGGANIYIMHPHAVVTNATNSSQYVLFSGVYQTS